MNRNSLASPASSRTTSVAGLPGFDDLFQSFFAPVYGAGATLPAIDLTETSEAYEVAVDVPGWNLDEIDVQLTNNVLSIRGDRGQSAQQPADSLRWHVAERNHGSFARSIKFPVGVDAAGVKATAKNGVLTVSVPKAATARAQKIKITEA